MRFFFAILSMAVTALCAFGVGGCGGGGSSFDPSVALDFNDFEGEFALRDHSCSFSPPVTRFRIRNSSGGCDFTMTVLSPADLEGEIFCGDLVEATLYFDEIRCGAARMTDEESATNVEEMTTVTTRHGDISAYCPDTASADGVCFLSFRPD